MLIWFWISGHYLPSLKKGLTNVEDWENSWNHFQEDMIEEIENNPKGFGIFS